ncbi:MAG: DUF1080 domain-containing protein [Anaerolineaceae bacterium]|nr:DUF1080 domain-containing protein [Anaerolineaceae bacterium]
MNQHETQRTKSFSKRGLIFFVLIILITISCVCTDELPIPDIFGGKDEEGTGPAPAGVLFQDDFSDANSGWEVGDYDEGSVGYKSDAYFVISSGESSAMWGVAGKDYDNIVIEVDVTQVRAPSNNNNDYGVMCRVQFTGDGYSFNISGDGYYSIQIAENDNYRDLVEWSESSAIHTGNATNHIRVVCDGSKLVLFVNGTKLAETTDTTFTKGDIAFAATTYELELTEINFDNLIVRKP